MGIVYKARQYRLDRMVALKMIKAGAGARLDDLARFEAEARAVAAIDHPNIIKIFEIGERDGLPYFSLEFLEGGSLADRIDGKPQPIDESARIVETLARASMWLTAGGSFTVTSSRRTSCWPATERRRSQTLAWSSDWRPTPPRRERGRFWARPATWRRSRPRAPRRWAPPPTSTRSAPRSTRCSRAGHRSAGHPSSTRWTWSVRPSRSLYRVSCLACPVTWKRDLRAGSGGQSRELGTSKPSGQVVSPARCRRTALSCRLQRGDASLQPGP